MSEKVPGVDECPKCKYTILTPYDVDNHDCAGRRVERLAVAVRDLADCLLKLNNEVTQLRSSLITFGKSLVGYMKNQEAKERQRKK